MTRERDSWRRERRAAIGLLAIATVLRIRDQLLLRVVVEAVGPSEIRSVANLHEILRRPLRVLLRRELARPRGIEAVAVVHHRPERAVVPGDARHLPQAGRVPLAVGLFLTELVLVEPPDASGRLEQGTWILPGDLRLAIRLLTHVRRRADVHVNAALAVEGKTLVLVLAPIGQPFGNHFRRSGRQQRAGWQLVADD